MSAPRLPNAEAGIGQQVAATSPSSHPHSTADWCGWLHWLEIDVATDGFSFQPGTTPVGPGNQQQSQRVRRLRPSR